jgi:Zn-dependent oligopeptidase
MQDSGGGWKDETTRVMHEVQKHMAAIERYLNESSIDQQSSTATTIGQPSTGIAQKSTHERALFEIDAISESLCSVIDAAEVCRNVHPNQSVVNNATIAVETLNHRIHELNADPRLYRALRSIVDHRTQLSSDEARLISTNLKVENELLGSNLPETTKPAVIGLQNEIGRLR